MLEDSSAMDIALPNDANANAEQCDQSNQSNISELSSEPFDQEPSQQVCEESSLLSSCDVEATVDSDSLTSPVVLNRRKRNSDDEDYTGDDLNGHKKRRFKSHLDAVAHSKLMVDAKKQKSKKT